MPTWRFVMKLHQATEGVSSLIITLLPCFFLTLISMHSMRCMLAAENSTLYTMIAF